MTSARIAATPTILPPPARNNPITIVAIARHCLPVLLSALLLFSQHVAVTHAIWHQAHGASAHASVSEAPAHSGDAKHAGELCGFDTLLGQLLAGGAIASGAHVPAADGAHALCSAHPHLLALAVVQPRSRGPPVGL